MCRITIVSTALLLLLLPAAAFARNMTPKIQPAKIAHVANDFPIADLDNKAWTGAFEVAVTRYWSGKEAPAGRHFTARLLWSDNALYIRFRARQNEPIVASENPDLRNKSMNLWDRDVCEIFLAPDSSDPNKYFEFEVAPTGEWLDVGLHVTPNGRQSDWNYNSGMQTAARIEKDFVVMAMRIEWKAFAKRPKAGDVWLGNLLRCVGKDPTRGYLAWSPTMTEQPNFHVPKSFGEFLFV